MFDEIKCPCCGSKDWSTVDIEYDYPNDNTMITRFLSYCDRCGCSFEANNEYNYVKSTVKEIKEGK